MRHLYLLALANALAGCMKSIPVPDVNSSMNDESHVARGRYLAGSGMGCVVCHSQRDWTHFGGPLVAGTAYAGSGDIPVEEKWSRGFHFGGPNLTPHHLSHWTDGEIVRAMLLGQGRDRHGLFSLMPYRIWRDAVPLEDAVDVVSFLRQLAPIDHDAPTRQLPFPGFVLDMLPEPRDLKAVAPKPGDSGYGAYVTARARCVDCHTDADHRGNFIGPAFAGGREFGVPSPGKGFVRSANLTPDAETGLGKWTKEMFVAKFKSSTLEVARVLPVGDDGFNTVMPWWSYSRLTEEDLGAIFDFLRAQPPVTNRVEKWSLAANHPANRP
jgi:mono/diheme cytochrome c family protein